MPTWGRTIAVLLLGSTAFAATSASKLGRVEFPSSGSAPARAHFLRGVAALHSFWYDEALTEFRRANQIDPGFAMGYWGQAMTYNHPIWAEQGTEAARQILAKVPQNARVNARERRYLDAVRALYGDGDKLPRDLAYAGVMQKLWHDYPDDLEAACFYALALLGSVRPGEPGFRRQMQAAAIVMDIFQKRPDHPGAAHYLIHALDDPEHAILALPAARRYASIAPEADHALHMPSHIFLQLGMWLEAAASNEAAFEAAALNHRPGGYHSLHWLIYVYLQQGRYREAEALLAKRVATGERLAGKALGEMASAAAALVVESERWVQAESLFAAGTEFGGAPVSEPGQHCAPMASPPPKGPRARSALPVFVRGFAEAARGDPAWQKTLASLAGLERGAPDDQQGYQGHRKKQLELMELEVRALAESRRSANAGIELAKKAAALEESMGPPSGPPDIIKPAHELLGELLLRAGHPKEAAAAFSTSLVRQPNRARSLLGAARAAAQLGERGAATASYGDFARRWSRADADRPELKEARDYLSTRVPLETAGKTQ